MTGKIRHLQRQQARKTPAKNWSIDHTSPAEPDDNGTGNSTNIDLTQLDNRYEKTDLSNVSVNVLTANTGDENG